MKYLRQKCFLAVVLIDLRLMRILVEVQLNQYPSASLGPLVTLEELQHRHPTARLGQTLLREHHVSLDQLWRKRALPQRARQTGVDPMSSRYFVVSALRMKQVSVVYFANIISGGRTLERPPCNGR